MMSTLLIYNSDLAQTEQIAKKTADFLRQSDITSFILTADDTQPCSEMVDNILVFGGDGTIIRVAKLYADREIPVLGINMGTVGFLCGLEMEELEAYLPRVLSGEYHLDERMLLQLEIVENGKCTHQHLALNEVCIKSQDAHMIQLQIKIGGNLHSLYKGDGLLVSTPTGSTAYSLAAGGPVVDPTLEVILITPLLSYLLSKRPLVIAGDKEICLEGRQEVFISVDGQTNFIVGPDFKILLRKAGVRFKLIDVKGRDFFASVEKRLGQTASPF